MVHAQESLKINLGCGHRWNAEWKNVDGGLLACLARLRALRIFDPFLPRRCFNYPPGLIFADLRRAPLPFPDESALVIFSGYALEYITPHESDRLLRDCYRILQPGGLLRLCQTDIGSIVRAYLANADNEPSPKAVENAATFLRLAAPQHTERAIRWFRRGGVQQLFDRPSIRFALAKAGFVSITFHDVRDGECPDLADLERPEREVAPLLHVEVRKPAERT